VGGAAVGLAGGQDAFDVMAWGGTAVLESGGRPGPGREGFGARAGDRVFVRMFRNPRRTRAGVSLCGATGFSHGRRRSRARCRARRSWVWAAMTSQVQRSDASGLRSFGAVQPRVCLNNRKVCSRSKPDCVHRRKQAGECPCHRGGWLVGAGRGRAEAAGGPGREG
jgi:hypothetical protein